MTKKKNRNAMKHGAFSEMILLPGESREEFDSLHDRVKEEFCPEGPIQEDKVFTITQNLWRKRRSGRYRRECVEYGEEILRREDNVGDGLGKFLEDVEAGKPISELKLPHEWASFFKEHYPRENYDSDDACLKALSNAVGYLWELLLDRRGKFTKEVAVNHFCYASVIAGELALEERIDAKIDRDIAALGRMKTMQGMGLWRRQISETSVQAKGKPLREIDSPSVQAEGSTVVVDKK
jgi:hypothetical protein